MANVPPMFTYMDTLDHAIRERITACLKRTGVSGRRFGLDAPGDPGFAASFERGTSLDAGDEPARPRMRSSPFRSAHGDGCRCPGLRAGPARQDTGSGHKHALRRRRAPADQRPARSRRPHRQGRARRRVESEDECRRDGWRIATGGNKFLSYSRVVRSAQECSMGHMSVSTVCNHWSIRVDSPSLARSLACLQRPEGAVAAMLMGAKIGETNALFAGLFHGFAAQSAPRPAKPGAMPLPPCAPCRGRLMQAPFSIKGR